LLLHEVGLGVLGGVPVADTVSMSGHRRWEDVTELTSVQQSEELRRFATTILKEMRPYALHVVLN
jgi:hypothetical protein